MLRGIQLEVVFQDGVQVTPIIKGVPFPAVPAQYGIHKESGWAGHVGAQGGGVNLHVVDTWGISRREETLVLTSG